MRILKYYYISILILFSASCSNHNSEIWSDADILNLFFFYNSAPKGKLLLMNPKKGDRLQNGSAIDFNWKYVGYYYDDPSELNSIYACKESITGSKETSEMRFKYYRLQIASSDFYDDLIYTIDTSNLSYQYTINAPTGQYFWRVVLVYQLQSLNCQNPRKYVSFDKGQSFIIE